MLHNVRRLAGLVLWLAIFSALAALVSCSERADDRGPEHVDSLIIPVYEDGIYRVSLKSLEEAGLSLEGTDEQSSVPPRLRHGDTEVPTFLTDDSLIFYGRGPADRYSRYRPYLLESTSAGTEIAQVALGSGDSETLTTLPYSTTFEENNFYDGRPYEGMDPDLDLRDPWFWDTIQFQDRLVVEFEMPRQAIGEAALQLDLVGVSSNVGIVEDHDIDVLINGGLLGTARWDGESATSLTLDIPEGLLQVGANELVLDNTAAGAAPIDIARLDRFTIGYRAEPNAVDGSLETESFQGQVTLTGFRDQPILLDVKQPDSPTLLPIEAYENGQITLNAGQGTRLYAVDEDKAFIPQTLIPRNPADLAQTDHQADFIVISPEAFVQALEPLSEHRRQQGLSVKLVSLEQIYDEFAMEGTGPEAIVSFVTHAVNNWTPPQPRYLLLVGDASYDYHDYLGLDPPVSLPAPMVPVTYSGETVSDARLADVDGDQGPDLAVGRWPVSHVDEVTDLIDRTIQAEQADRSASAAFVSDGTELRFLELSEDLGEQAGLTQELTLYLNGPTNQQIAEQWAKGAWVVTYVGHGSLDRWGKEGMLDNEFVPQLQSSTAPPIVLQLTCLTGLFAHPTVTSLSESMLLEAGGSISIVAATSLTLSDHQRPFGLAFLKALQDPSVLRVGDAFQLAKEQLDIESVDELREISDTFTLFGDPTALVLRPGAE